MNYVNPFNYWDLKMAYAVWVHFHAFLLVSQKELDNRGVFCFLSYNPIEKAVNIKMVCPVIKLLRLKLTCFST